ILDVHGRIIAILLGRPEDPDWDAVIQEVCKVFEHVRRAGRRGSWFRPRDTRHRRGRYAVLTAGVSFGGGQKRPGNLVNGPRQKLVNYILRNKSVRRLAGFQSSGMARYAPKLWRYYVDILQKLFDHDKNLQHLFMNSLFPAASFNLGPNVVTDGHIDTQNFVPGLCGITSGGNFDHTVGGQIYLKQLNLVIDFPSGSTILIPSGFIEHGNTPTQPGERRISFTQYAAGGLFRWVHCGFRTAKSLLATGGDALIASFDGPPGSRWRWALNLFSKRSELDADRQTALGTLCI
ncbi:hypothetical protein C8R46DRAFT_922798, partial [Mycena filopes]